MRNPGIAALALGLAIAPGVRTDIPPAPGEQQATLLRVIEDAGHACDKVASFAAASGSEADTYANQGLDAFNVTCGNGKTYLVAVPQRRPGPPQLDPSGKPVPLPAPVVKEVDQ